MITRLLVEHFRSIGQINLSLSSTTILVGPNATGKSNLVDSLRLLKDALTNGLDRSISDRQGIDTIRQWSPTRPYHVTIEVELDGKRGSGRYRLTLGSKKGNYIILGESGQWRRRIMLSPGRQRLGSPATFTNQTVSFERTKSGRVCWRVWNDDQFANESQFDVEFADELFLRSPFPQISEEDRASASG
ncbi:MAG: AAA family ATPase, partial [Geminicoccaceae bacterium]